MRKVLMLLVLMLAFLLPAVGCTKRETAAGSSAATDTIAPAASQPADNGTDSMTQTVELQDGRPEAEGGALTTPNPDVRTPGGSPPATTTTGTTATTATTGTTATTATR